MSKRFNYVRTKKLSNGNKLVVIGIGCKYEYAPKYEDLSRVIFELIKLYGKDEVFEKLGLSSFVCKGEVSLCPEFKNIGDRVIISETEMVIPVKMKYYLREIIYNGIDEPERSVWIKDPYTGRYFPLKKVGSENEVKNVESISQ